MRIEDYWQDVSIYMIEFETESNKQVQKYIVLNDQPSAEEIERIIRCSFNKVTKITSIDELTTVGLHLKELRK